MSQPTGFVNTNPMACDNGLWGSLEMIMFNRYSIFYQNEYQ